MTIPNPTEFKHIVMDENVLLTDEYIRKACELKQIKNPDHREDILATTHITICKISTNGSEYFGYAFCSEKDQFSRKRGRLISEGRALKQIKKGA